jgi:16S rRNA (uracil1498-N3)-methyltransferase
VVERRDLAPMITLFWDEEVARGVVRVTGAAAQHARVRRVEPGDEIRLLDGQGHTASGLVQSLGKDALVVSVQGLSEVPRPTALDVIVPVADRDRMLLAAEKCAELQVTSWRPAYFARSRSVSPRGEGSKFRDKVIARMRGALEQSGGAWMPNVEDEMEFVDALRHILPDRKKFVLDAGGDSLARLAPSGPAAVAIGPEGGIEEDEIAAAKEIGWALVSLGAATLRFETAIIAGVAMIRAAQQSRGSV